VELSLLPEVANRAVDVIACAKYQNISEKFVVTWFFFTNVLVRFNLENWKMRSLVSFSDARPSRRIKDQSLWGDSLLEIRIVLSNTLIGNNGIWGPTVVEVKIFSS
jgi:hypothetical protein